MFEGSLDLMMMLVRRHGAGYVDVSDCDAYCDGDYADRNGYRPGDLGNGVVGQIVLPKRSVMMFWNVDES
jgi:hypothetical protein